MNDACWFKYGGKQICSLPRAAHEGTTRIVITHGFVDSATQPSREEANRAMRSVAQVIARRKENYEVGPFEAGWNALRSLAREQRHPRTGVRCACGAADGGPAGTQSCEAISGLSKAAAHIRRTELKRRSGNGR